MKIFYSSTRLCTSFHVLQSRLLLGKRVAHVNHPLATREADFIRRALRLQGHKGATDNVERVGRPVAFCPKILYADTPADFMNVIVCP